MGTALTDRASRHRLCFALATAAVATLAGCADDFGGGLFVVQNLAPTDGESCAFTADLTAPYYARGEIRTDSPLPYIFHPLIQSRITAVEGTESQRTVSMKGARVSLAIVGATVDGESIEIDAASFPAGAAKFTSLFSAPVAPGGVTAAEFDMIPTTFLEAVGNAVGTSGSARVQIVATATVYGELGGDEISSDPFTYPVVICNDCVFQNIGPCTADTQPGSGGNPCNPYQDGVVQCCSSGNDLVCPAAPTPAP